MTREAGRGNAGRGRSGRRGAVPIEISVEQKVAVIAPARAAAFQILGKIQAGSAHSDDLLHSKEVEKLSALDKNLCVTLVMGVLRWELALDAAVRPLLARPQEKLPVETAVALRLGAFQLLLLERIPVHAAINESVELVKQSTASRSAGMVNAVLRKVVPLRGTKLDALAAYPVWLRRRWVRNYGLDGCSAICAAGQAQPELTVRVGDADGIEGMEPGHFLSSARIVDGLVDAAGARMQDEGSQLIAELCGRVTGAAGRILDCCAAPGGKTAVLAELNPGVEIVACDVSAGRLKRMQSLLSDFASAKEIWYEVADATAFPQREPFVGEFELILCDVPCSGTGTLGRNPEIRYRLQPEHLERHQKRQIELLTAAMGKLAKGGRLMYSTCSLEPEENEQVVEACLAGMSGFRRVDLEEVYEERMGAGAVAGDAAEALRESGFRDGYLRTVPGVHPCDGFFGALITRE